MDPEDSGTGIDPTIPHSARIWNYWLGGNDNYPVDREAGDAWLAVHPEIAVIARSTRAFLQRGVRYLAEIGIRQFLDIGTGLPTADNTHEVAQRVAPDARIVYVDNDPLILAHARALMTSTPEGETHYLHTDMRDPATLLKLAGEHLDFTRPVAVIFMEVLGHLPTAQDVKQLVSTVMDATAPGSYLLIGDGIEVEGDDAVRKASEEYAETGAVPYHVRPLADLRSLFDGLEFVEPGLVSVTQWRPDRPEGLPTVGMSVPEPLDNVFGGLARKPVPGSA
jgi:O-methyltransferase involved in polyketide biosynthesis